MQARYIPKQLTNSDDYGVFDTKNEMWREESGYHWTQNEAYADHFTKEGARKIARAENRRHILA